MDDLPVAREIYKDGHAELTPQELAYVGDMANRVGFHVIKARPDIGTDVFQIELKIPMRNATFLARLGDLSSVQEEDTHG